MYTSAQDLQRAREAGVEWTLHAHVEQPGGFELTGAIQWAGVDRPQPSVRDEARDGRLRVVVVAGDQDVERLPGDLAVSERAGEGRVERLDHARLRCELRELLRRGAVGWRHERVV